MKVLFLSNIPSPYRVDFFNELGKKCELTVSFEGKFATDRNSGWKGSEMTDFTPIFQKGIRIGKDSFYCPKVIKILKEEWDIIILGGYSTPTLIKAIRFLRRKRKPFYIEVDGGSIKQEKGFLYRFKHKLISSATGWFSTGKEVNKYLCHYGADPQKIYIYPFTSLLKKDFNRADILLNFGKMHYRDKLGIKEQKIIISVGRFSYQAGYGKGYDIIMRIAQNLSKDIGIYIVGDEPTEEFLKIQKDNDLTNVHFIGFKNKEELAEYYVASDLSILLTRGDVWGLVVNESMMYGLPIITSDKCVAGVELIENDVSGYVVDINNEKNIEYKILKLVNDDKLASDFGHNGRKKIEQYTIEEMAEKHYKIFNLLVKK